MEKYFCNYNQSLALKELGFNESCWSYFITPFDDGEGIFNPSMFLKDYDYLDTMPKNSTYILAPLKSQVFEWFRKNHKLRHNVMDFIDNITGIEWDYEIATIGTDLDENGNYIPLVDYSIDDETRKFKTYEEAESACIDKLIEIVKNGR